MRTVSLDDIVGIHRYEEMRDEFRRRIIDLKKQRRLPVGDRITFVFENFDTALFQIQEMLRAERITDLDRVREEIEVYNELVPRPGELSATMLIEITEQEHIRPELVRLIGIESCVNLLVGSQHRVPGVFESGRSTEDNLSAVQYVRFGFGEDAKRAFCDPSVAARLAIDHRNYRHAAAIEGRVRASLIDDLGAP